MSSTTIPNYAPPPARPLRGGPRITWQMVVFAAVPIVIIVSILYMFLQPAVKDVGNGYKEVNLKAISNFPLDQYNGTINDIPKQWRELDGQKVVLFGELWQPYSAGNGKLDGFDLCYSVAKCCFTGEPQVQHFVKSSVVPGRNLYPYPNLVKVTGTLHVDVKKDAEGGKLTQVYRLDVENLEPST